MAGNTEKATKKTIAEEAENSAISGEETTEATETTAAEQIQKEYLEERIPYVARRPIGSSQKETEVTVTINGYNYRVKYDEEVMIPRFVVEVLERAYQESKRVSEKIETVVRESAPIAEM